MAVQLLFSTLAVWMAVTAITAAGLYFKPHAPATKYVLVIDSGSSGQRMYAYTWSLPGAGHSRSGSGLPAVQAIPPSAAAHLVPKKAKKGAATSGSRKPPNPVCTTCSSTVGATHGGRGSSHHRFVHTTYHLVALEAPNHNKHSTPSYMAQNSLNQPCCWLHSAVHCDMPLVAGLYNRVETQPGLDAFAGDSAGLRTTALEPLLAWARAVVPQQQHGVTPLFLLGTGGLRRMAPQAQAALMAETRKVLAASGFRYATQLHAGVQEEGNTPVVAAGDSLCSHCDVLMSGSQVPALLWAQSSLVQHDYAHEFCCQHTNTKRTCNRVYDIVESN